MIMVDVNVVVNNKIVRTRPWLEEKLLVRTEPCRAEWKDGRPECPFRPKANFMTALGNSFGAYELCPIRPRAHSDK